MTTEQNVPVFECDNELALPNELAQATIAERLWRVVRAPRTGSGASLFVRFAKRAGTVWLDWTDATLTEAIYQRAALLHLEEHPPIVLPLGEGIFLLSFAGHFSVLQLQLLREQLRTELTLWAVMRGDLKLSEVAEPFTWQERSESRLPFPKTDTLRSDLDWVLEPGRLFTLFQPIVSLQQGQTVGWEALCRTTATSPLALPDALFACAGRFGLLEEIDAACQQRAMVQGAPLTKEGRLFVNVYPDSLYSQPFSRSPLVREAERLQIPPSQIVIEINERQAIRDFGGFVKVLDSYRERGFRVAVDDAGSGYSSLQSIAELSPDYVKIDRSLIRDVDITANKTRFACDDGTVCHAHWGEHYRRRNRDPC